MEKRMMYLLIGRTGEYSDRTEWFVGVYEFEHAANDRRDALNAKLREAGAFVDSPSEGTHLWNRDAQGALRSELGDPGMQMDYTGAEYMVTAVEVLS